VLDLNPLEAGIVFLTFSVPLVVMSPVGGRMVSRYGSQLLMAIGMAMVGAGVTCFAFIDTSTGVPLVVAGLVIAGFGQGFAYNLSNTAGMEAMPDDKAGVASGVLQTSRLMGIVIGFAVSGSLFKALENRKLFSLFDEGLLSSGEKGEMRGLVSGSDVAVQRLHDFSGIAQHKIESYVDQAFVHGLRGVMILSAVLCVFCIWPALWGRQHATAEAHPGVAHPLWPHLWRRQPGARPAQA
jgi:MFS family permease